MTTSLEALRDVLGEGLDASEQHRGRLASADVAFALSNGDSHVGVRFRDGRFTASETAPAFTIESPAWPECLSGSPERHRQNVFALLMRVPGTRIVGDEVSFAQHAHVVGALVDSVRGDLGASPPPEHPSRLTGRYVDVDGPGGAARVFWEEAGSGRDILFLHTAGADSRQYHRLMNDPDLANSFRMVAFDLPGHGRSGRVHGNSLGEHALTTEDYAGWVISSVEAVGLARPVVVGASMAGHICLELGLRAPDVFGGVIACEAADHVPGRRPPWGSQPGVNDMLFVPTWVDGLASPYSPAVCREEIWWGYSQGGFNTFVGDIHFYSGEWDARERIHTFDTGKCPLVMMTGEFDYSCTAEMSEATAARIEGSIFRRMPGLGHFPHAENPVAFREHLLWALAQIEEATR